MTREEAIECLELLRIMDAPKLTEAVHMAIEALEAQRWIPCSERLPKKAGTYLITVELNNKRFVCSDDYFSYGWDDYGDDVIAWAELPEPYREEQE